MKILAVFTGGTIGSVRSGGNILPNEQSSADLLDMYRKSGGRAEFVTTRPYNILSENLSGKNLAALYGCIKSYDLSQFDGVIVTCGTDTLQYTCAYLSYAFGLCSTPIAVVSANYPLSDKRSNGLQNFSAAVTLIASGQAEGVFAAYQNSGETAKLHRASRLLPHLPYSDNVASVFDSVYGEIINGCLVLDPEFSEQDDGKDFCVDPIPGESSEILYVTPYVGMDYPKLCKDTKAVLLSTYHSGTLNTDDGKLKTFCKTADSLEIPVFLTGETSGFEYASKSVFDELNIHILPSASPVAMYVKLWLLRDGNLKDVYKPFGGDFA